MEKILKLIYGYIIILVRGEYPESFLNLCRSRKIYMEKIQYKNNDQVTAQMRAGDFWRLRPVRSKYSDYTKTGNALLFFRK